MIADLNPYAEYKDSGSCWLANVPLQWKLQNLRVPIRSRNERNRPDLPLLSVAREKGLFVRSLTDADENHNVIPEDLSNYKVVRAGNFVVNKMKSWQGSMGIAPVDGIVSPAYFVYDFAMYSGDLRGSSSREGRSSSRRCRSSRSFWTRSRPRGADLCDRYRRAAFEPGGKDLGGDESGVGGRGRSGWSRSRGHGQRRAREADGGAEDADQRQLLTEPT